METTDFDDFDDLDYSRNDRLSEPHVKLGGCVVMFVIFFIILGIIIFSNYEN
jgi:hypothetical protein